ncbi:MAG: hypothetical protein KKD44_26935 [Proteobacteria bacterium]|nr:hypothetical protein [Pseudomonadota bacterium]
MEATLERKELHGHTIETLPATQDAKMAAEHLMRAYPEWQLRKVGVLDRVISLSQRLSQVIRDGDVEAICRIRVSLRDSLTKMERTFGARELDGGLVATSDMVVSGDTRRLEPRKGVSLFRRN